MHGHAEFVAILGEATRDLDQHALLDIVQDLLVAGFIADQQQPQAIVFQDFERRARHIGLGGARPGDAELAHFPGDGLGAGQVVGEGVVVEEEFLDLREGLFRPGDFLGHMADAAGAVAMAADGLRPQAEGAARLAAAPGIDRQIGMLQVAAEIDARPGDRAGRPATRRAGNPCFQGFRGPCCGGSRRWRRATTSRRWRRNPCRRRHP